MIFLAIETSCDETAVAVVEDGRSVLANLISSQVDLHARYGGVVPELASRAHVQAINPLMAEALDLDADQRAKAQGFFAEARAKAEGSSDPDARRAAMREAMGKLETILRPDQKAKLAELRAHMGGGQGGGAQP